MKPIENVDNEPKIVHQWERYHVKTPQDIMTMRALFQKDSPNWAAIDTETTGLNIAKNGDKAFLIIFGWISSTVERNKRSFTFEPTEVLLAHLKTMMKTCKIVWGFNSKYDLNILRNTGSAFTDYKDYDFNNFWDVLGLWRLTHNVETDVKKLSLKHLASIDLDKSANQFKDDVEMIYKRLKSEHKKKFMAYYYQQTNKKLLTDKLNKIINYDIFAQNTDLELWEQFCAKNPIPTTHYDPFLIDSDLVIRYAHADVIYTLELAIKYWPEIKARKQLKVLQQEMAVIVPLANQERTGICVDFNYLKASKDKVQEYYAWVQDSLYATVKQALQNPWRDLTNKNTYIEAVALFASTQRTKNGVKDFLSEDIAQRKVDNFLELLTNKQLININSTDHLRLFMFATIGIKSTSWDKNKFNQTYDAVANKLKDTTVPDKARTQLEYIKRFIELLQIYRRVSKWANTYIGRFLKAFKDTTDNRLHPTFHAYKTVTGRFSSALQQEPRDKLVDIRNNQPIFDPRAMVKKSDDPNIVCVLAADLSQIEIRVNAEYTYKAGQPDKLLVDSILNGVDMHTRLAAQAFHPDLPITQAEQAVSKKERTLAKNLGFAMQYGGGKNAIRNHHELSKLPISVQDGLLDTYDKTRAGTRYYQKWAMQQAQKNIIKLGDQMLCYAENMYGRRYYASTTWANGDGVERGNAYRFINYLIQGTCAYALKHSLVTIDNLLRPKHIKSRIITNIHDEIQVEIYAGEEWLIPKIKTCMEDMPWATHIPMKCDLEVFTDTWSNKIDYAQWLQERNTNGKEN